MEERGVRSSSSIRSNPSWLALALEMGVENFFGVFLFWLDGEVLESLTSLEDGLVVLSLSAMACVLWGKSKCSN